MEEPLCGKGKPALRQPARSSREASTGNNTCTFTRTYTCRPCPANISAYLER
jgi:hypothetical protein